MTLDALTFGSMLFGMAFGIHVAWWRIARPADDFRALAVSFFVLPAILSAMALAAGIGVTTAREAVAAVLVTIAAGAIYIMYYPAAQAASPSMLLVLEIHRGARRGGTTRAELNAAFDNELLCRQSIANLVHEHFADEAKGKLTVAPRGEFLLRMLNTWRGLLGLRYGSG